MYREFKAEECRFTFISNKSNWKKNYKGSSVVSEDIIAAINIVLRDMSRIESDNVIRYLAILCSYANSEEIVQCVTDWNLEKKFDRSLDSFICRYGKCEGAKLHKEDRVRIESNKDKIRNNNPIWVEYWLKKGYNEEGAKKQVKCARIKESKKNYNPKNRYYPKISELPQRIEYWLKKGYNEEDAYIECNIFKERFIHNKNKYIGRYGAKEGLKRWNDLVARRKDTRLKNILNGNIEYGKASKESLIVFQPIISWLIGNNKVKRSEIFIGYDNSKEWRVYNRFYDFTIPSKKIIIEYNGILWHPKSPDTDDFILTPGDMTIMEKFNYDREKIALAESSGFEVLELWSDDSVEYNIKKCMSFIDRKLNER